MNASPKISGSGQTEDYVTWTVIGGLEIGLRTRRIEHIEDDLEDEGERSLPTIDLAAVLGRPAGAQGDSSRLIFVDAEPPYALRIRGKVMLTGPTPDVLIDLPPFVDHLRVRPGIEAVSAREQGFGYVLDLDRVGLRLGASLRPGPTDGASPKGKKP